MKQVWPGDTLTATATVTAVSDGVAELTLETVNQAGEPCHRHGEGAVD